MKTTATGARRWAGNEREVTAWSEFFSSQPAKQGKKVACILISTQKT